MRERWCRDLSNKVIVMGILRPEIGQAVYRYRDALIGAAVSFFGINWALSSVGFMSILGTALSIAGALLLFAGIQRGRFVTGRDGRGMVTIDEGQVTYFGPDEGGTVHVDDLVQVDLLPPDDGSGAEWLLLSAEDEEPLRIPLNAVGADALFDVFVRLDGIRTSRMLAQLNHRPEKQVVIWRAGGLALD